MVRVGRACTKSKDSILEMVNLSDDADANDAAHHLQEPKRGDRLLCGRARFGLATGAWLMVHLHAGSPLAIDITHTHTYTQLPRHSHLD